MGFTDGIGMCSQRDTFNVPVSHMSRQDHALLKFVPDRNSYCRLSAFWPQRLSLQDKMLILESPDLAGSPQVTIQAHYIPSHVFEATQNLTWSSRPSSGPVWRTLTAAFGSDHVPDRKATFLCKEGVPIVVELSCMEAGCRLEYEDKAGSPQLGKS